MYSSDELKSLHGFLRTTPEAGLKGMLVGGKMTETHLKALMKVVRAANEDEWVTHWELRTFPRVKLNPQEVAVKENFYTVCGDACAKVGLLTSGAVKAA